MAWKPVVYLDDAKGDDFTGYTVPGWYFRDPSDRYATDGLMAASGPFATEQAATEAFENYCEAMTI